MRVIGVVRVSTQGQGLGAKAQRAQLAAWAERSPHELAGVFEDVGVSGDAPLRKRQGLKGAIHSIADGHGDALVAVEPSRFARLLWTWVEVLSAIKAVGGVLMTTDGALRGEDSRDEDMRMCVAILSSSIESRLHKERNRRRATECAAQGRMHGGAPPFGFRRKADGQRSTSGRVVELEMHPGEQAAMARMAKLRADGLSFEGVALALQSEGFKPRGTEWRASTVRRVLKRTGPGGG